jgi:hypothetical protein
MSGSHQKVALRAVFDPDKNRWWQKLLFSRRRRRPDEKTKANYRRLRATLLELSARF